MAFQLPYFVLLPMSPGICCENVLRMLSRARLPGKRDRSDHVRLSLLDSAFHEQRKLAAARLVLTHMRGTIT